jgi:hypothetical protein
MKNPIDTLAGLAATFASLAISHLRGMLGVIAGVTFLFAAHAAFQRIVAGQAEQQAQLDQLTKPVAQAPAPAATAALQKWCTVDNWPSNCK